MSTIGRSIRTCAMVATFVFVQTTLPAPTVRAADASYVPPVINVDENDHEMNAAILHARKTVARFLHALKHRTNRTHFAIKMRLADPKVPDYAEYIWISNISFDGRNLHGTVDDGDEPQKVTRAKVGDRLSILPAKVADWMYLDNGHLRGGYSIRLLYRRSSSMDQVDLRLHTGLTDAELRASD